MSEKKRFYITTPIYYVNDAPHIGHAYTSLACDVLARFKRLNGYDVKFLTGTDEHGQKVEKSARAEGTAPTAFTDRVSQNFRDLALFMNFSNDDFIRTTEDRHAEACRSLWKSLFEKDQIYLSNYSGWYAIRDEAFYDEGELNDGPDGLKLAPTGAPVEWVEEPSYFFRLSAWQDKLLQFYDNNSDFIQPVSRRNEVLNFVSGGLQDLSVSRTTFNWGISVPGDNNHVIYVWLDALINYITAVGYPKIGEGTDYSRYWPANVHMVGKDILRFHAVYWPAFLMAAGLEPPHSIFAHGWWTNEGQKISKSLKNIIDPVNLVETYGLDQVRYFLLREVPFGRDGDFSHSSMVSRLNGDLANDYGNLVQRVLTLVFKNCNEQVPLPQKFLNEDSLLLKAANDAVKEAKKSLEKFAFHESLEEIWRVIRLANGYIDRQAPWKLSKEDPERMETVLYVLMETLRYIAILTQPFMPHSSNQILDQLSVAQEKRTYNHLNEAHSLAPGRRITEPFGVFPRYQDNKK